MGEDFKKAVQAHGKENGAAEEVAKYKTAIATKEGLKAFLLLGMLLMWLRTVRCSVISP